MLDIEIVVRHDGRDYSITKGLSLPAVHELIGLCLAAEANPRTAPREVAPIARAKRKSPFPNNPAPGNRIIDYARRSAATFNETFKMKDLLAHMEASGWNSTNPNRLNNVRATLRDYQEEFKHIGDSLWTYTPLPPES